MTNGIGDFLQGATQGVGYGLDLYGRYAQIRDEAQERERRQAAEKEIRQLTESGQFARSPARGTMLGADVLRKYGFLDEAEQWLMRGNELQQIETQRYAMQAWSTNEADPVAALTHVNRMWEAMGSADRLEGFYETNGQGGIMVRGRLGNRPYSARFTDKAAAQQGLTELLGSLVLGAEGAQTVPAQVRQSDAAAGLAEARTSTENQVRPYAVAGQAADAWNRIVMTPQQQAWMDAQRRSLEAATQSRQLANAEQERFGPALAQEEVTQAQQQTRQGAVQTRLQERYGEPKAILDLLRAQEALKADQLEYQQNMKDLLRNSTSLEQAQIDNLVARTAAMEAERQRLGQPSAKESWDAAMNYIPVDEAGFAQPASEPWHNPQLMATVIDGVRMGAWTSTGEEIPAAQAGEIAKAILSGDIDQWDQQPHPQSGAVKVHLKSLGTYVWLDPRVLYMVMAELGGSMTGGGQAPDPSVAPNTGPGGLIPGGP